jgi:DNA repair protein RadD
MLKVLRPYQAKAVAECWEALKKDANPVLLMASVGAGKSLMLASILLAMEKQGKRALCLVNNAELVRSNAETLVNQGGTASIYCAAIGEKDCSAPVVFGTPQSVLNGITKKQDISKIAFNIIVVDEAHAINYNHHRSSFMRILRFYRQSYENMRVLGATGTQFRFKGAPIVGEECLFKTQVGNITTEQLIKDGYLVQPEFEIDKELMIDFSGVKVKSNGQFDQKQLVEVVEKNARLTELICKQVVHLVQSQDRRGVFLFATTKRHAYEILSHLPSHESAIILGDTPQDKRTSILGKARRSEIKYLVNIAVLTTGIDVPNYDTLAYLRPTESLVLMVQTMGRVLRLSPGKDHALVLDFAGNIQRHRDWDNPLLLEAVKKELDKDNPLVIVCPACSELNTEHARRCIGTHNQARCDYFFEFKECHGCQIKNDITSRYCYSCEAELIDPNAKLSLKIKSDLIALDVNEVKYAITGSTHSFMIHAAYYCYDPPDGQKIAYEYYKPISQKAKNVFYGQFIRKHCEHPSDWYMHLGNREKMELMLKEIRSPIQIKVIDEGGTLKIKKKVFA